MAQERSAQELYRDDPQRADAEVFGRRGELEGASLQAMQAAVGASIPAAATMQAGTLPAAFARPGALPLLTMPGKAALLLHDERPLCAETPEVLLDEAVTSAPAMFIRNNGGIPPEVAEPLAWRFTVEGKVQAPLSLTVGDLQSRFPVVTRQLQLECGGNGRAFHQPAARGNPWGNGAISNGEWTGVRLRDVLLAAGLRPTARFTGHYGADPHLSGEAGQVSIARGMRIEKALDEDTLLAFGLNGAPLPHLHGAPLRLVVPGWPGSLSQKWLTRISVRDVPHDGPGMGGTSYRVPLHPVIPGSAQDGRDFVELESMPVRSILTSHAHGMHLPAGTRHLDLRGAAWAGDLSVQAQHVSLDFGATWRKMALFPAANRHAWQRWQGRVTVPADGYYEIWYRATDSAGRMQPHQAANWNPQGYGANPTSRAAVFIGRALAAGA
ncbi:sulfite oxidase [Falsiroseomonas sp. E2-1-a4]|uniref:sulfite oxidase n=1 Tax=Falsiroseomonas sp. E2-1-a4 TaxID=3239299 RepID=UPI003F3DC0CD